MGNIGLIIEQEYRNRVVKKSFILLTILMPILFAALIFVPLWLASIESDEVQNIAVDDQTGLYGEVFKNMSNSSFNFILLDTVVGNNVEMVQSSNSYDAMIIVSADLAKNPNAISYYGEKMASGSLVSVVENSLSDYVEKQKLASYNIPDIEKIIKDSHTDVNMATYKFNDAGGVSASNSDIASLIGILATVLIYMFIFTSGSMVMQSIIQEKVNRVVEVMICTVRPWQLMWGKIIAVALVSLTQMLIWLVMTCALVYVGGNMTGFDVIGSAAAVDTAAVPTADMSEFESIIYTVSSINWFYIATLFVIYFVLGYLLYASLFAAVGSAVDNEADTNQFLMPITILVLFALYAGMYSAENPDGPLAFWCSLIPLTSPIVMMVRAPFEVPMWQIITSISLLFVTLLFTVWFSSKIYRVGILMYGKKPSWKEIIKWLKY